MWLLGDRSSRCHSYPCIRHMLCHIRWNRGSINRKTRREKGLIRPLRQIIRQHPRTPGALTYVREDYHQAMPVSSDQSVNKPTAACVREHMPVQGSKDVSGPFPSHSHSHLIPIHPISLSQRGLPCHVALRRSPSVRRYYVTKFIYQP